MTYTPTGGLDASIWSGLETYADATSLARASRQLERVRPGGLKASFEIAARLLRSLEDPDFCVREVAGIIEGDPVLATRVLGIANSPMFSRQGRCRDISHAVALLGARCLSEVAAAATAAGLYKRFGVQARMRDHSLSTAAVARRLATRLGASTDDVFLAGLLHDVGKLVFLQGAGDERYGMDGSSYAALLERRAGRVAGTHLIEQASQGFDHAALGCVALREWGIPEPVPRAVGWHHDLERARQEGGRMAELVSLLRLADSLSHAFAGPRLEVQTTRLLIREPVAMACLGLEPEDLDLALPELRHAHAAAIKLLD